MSCTARSMTTPTFDMRGGNGPTRVIAMDRISSAADRILYGFYGRIESLDVTDHQRDTCMPRGSYDGPAFRDGRRDRLFDQHMHAALDRGEREVPMQMGGGGDGQRVDAQCEQLVDVIHRGAAERPGNPVALLAVRIGHPDQLHARQSANTRA